MESFNNQFARSSLKYHNIKDKVHVLRHSDLKISNKRQGQISSMKLKKNKQNFKVKKLFTDSENIKTEINEKSFLLQN